MVSFWRLSLTDRNKGGELDAAALVLGVFRGVLESAVPPWLELRGRFDRVTVEPSTTKVAKDCTPASCKWKFPSSRGKYAVPSMSSLSQASEGLTFKKLITEFRFVQVNYVTLWPRLWLTWKRRRRFSTVTWSSCNSWVPLPSRSRDTRCTLVLFSVLILSGLSIKALNLITLLNFANFFLWGSHEKVNT